VMARMSGLCAARRTLMDSWPVRSPCTLRVARVMWGWLDVVEGAVTGGGLGWVGERRWFVCFCGLVGEGRKMVASPWSVLKRGL
jgi:hypothetical protein